MVKVVTSNPHLDTLYNLIWYKADYPDAYFLNILPVIQFIDLKKFGVIYGKDHLPKIVERSVNNFLYKSLGYSHNRLDFNVKAKEVYMFFKPEDFTFSLTCMIMLFCHNQAMAMDIRDLINYKDNMNNTHKETITLSYFKNACASTDEAAMSKFII